MAKGSRDVILRDRLEFTTTAGGDTSLVYGRVDMSDDPNLTNVPANSIVEANICAFATTTAYENAADVGIASPNVLCMYELKSQAFSS